MQGKTKNVSSQLKKRFMFYDVFHKRIDVLLQANGRKHYLIGRKFKLNGRKHYLVGRKSIVNGRKQKNVAPQGRNVNHSIKNTHDSVQLSAIRA